MIMTYKYIKIQGSHANNKNITIFHHWTANICANSYFYEDN